MHSIERRIRQRKYFVYHPSVHFIHQKFFPCCSDVLIYNLSYNQTPLFPHPLLVSVIMHSVVRRIRPRKYCAFPVYSFTPLLRLYACAGLCTRTLGCYSFNFRPLPGSSVGDCVIVAPSAANKVFDVGPVHLWDYYVILELFKP
jgi:hypothetical protein